MPLNSNHLATLKLRPGEINNLPEDLQKKKIKDQYVKLSLIHHPDKNPPV